MLTPLKPRAWDVGKAAHLINRAGFGGTPSQIEALYKLGLDGAVEQLLNSPDEAAQFPKPETIAPENLVTIRRQNREGTEEERIAKRRERMKQERGQINALTRWWLGRMRETSHPLREKLTLFWHGHFATSSSKVREAYYLWLQNETLRRNALGNFGVMVKEILRDPAMLIWLDGDKSLSFKPNENLAREMMELFTLGIGNYGEEDVQVAARAFTGYKVNPANQAFRYAPLQHDDGEKVFLGRKGRFTGEEVVDIMLKQPACASFISRKLWTFFAYENPSPQWVASMAKELSRNRYELRPAMRMLFRSAEFYSPRAVRMQIKSPVQWMIGIARQLETPLPPYAVTSNLLRELGQVPFAPPNVKGWDGGKAWITTSTLLARYNFSAYASGSGTMKLEPAPKQRMKHPNRKTREMTPTHRPGFLDSIPAAVREDPRTLVAQLTFRLFQSPLTERETGPFVTFLENRPATDDTIMDLLNLMMSTPQYQLT